MMARFFLVVSIALSIVASSSVTAPAQDQYIERNTDRPGGDYTSFDLPPKGPGSLWDAAADCQLTCQRDANCRAWTYVAPGVQGPQARCWLKNTIPAARASDCCISGVTLRAVEPNTDRPGSDYNNFDLAAADANACRAACQNDQQCQAWTYVNPGVQGPQARCWLKNAVPAAHTSDCCTSGVMDRGVVVR